MDFDHLQFLSVFSWSLYKRRGVDLTTLLYPTESYMYNLYLSSVQVAKNKVFESDSPKYRPYGC